MASETPGSYNFVREVPGNDSFVLRHLIDILWNGHFYFTARKARYKSSVFKINMGVKAVAVCDKKAIQALFDVNVVEKEKAFGRLRYNTKLLDDYCPSMFSNGPQHEKQKLFLMKICDVARNSKVLPVASRVVKEYLRRWENADELMRKNFEQSIMEMTSDIFTEALLGVRIDAVLLNKFLYGVWGKGKYLKEAMAASVKLKEAVSQSPSINHIIDTALEAGLTEFEALRDILFMLIFNAYGGTSGALKGCVARLSLLDAEAKQSLKKEIENELRGNTVTEETLCNMKQLHNFALEVLRLHPGVPVFFGRARNDFTLESESGDFAIEKGQLLVGNVYLVQRDPEIFENPDEFIPSRFKDEELRHHLLYGHGAMTGAATTKNHQCPGQDITIMTMKIFLSHMLQYCDFELTKKPFWTGRKLRRLGAPDKRMKLHFLKSNGMPASEEYKCQIEDLESP